MNWKPLSLSVDPLGDSALDLDLIKSHCNIDLSDQDDLLDLYVRSAIEDAESFMHRTIVQRSHRWVLDGFPCNAWERIRLPRGKTQSVTSIQYSLNGSILTLTGPSASPVGTGFQEDLSGDDGGFLSASRTQGWPSVDYDAVAPVTVRFVAGYDPDDIPADILHWIAFSVSDANQNRDSGGSINVVRPQSEVRQGVLQAMLSGYILNRTY